MNSKIWSRNYFLQTASNMESDSGKIKGIGNIKQILKRNKKNGNVMPVHVECAKPTLSVLALLTKSCNVFSFGHRYSNTTCFSIFFNRNSSPRIDTTDTISL